ncbi:MAG TPA: hypothetical protein VM888_14915, partial [Chitinophagaceae bacterium]|nr:hypothetical protein [Chitinophagaceae bacterium]
MIAASKGILVIEGSNAVKSLYLQHKIENENLIDFCWRWFAEKGPDVFAKANINPVISNGINLEKIVFIGCRR